MKRIKRMFAIFLVMLFTITLMPMTVSAATLRNGSKGTEVRYLQMNLNGLGYGNLTVDSKYGPATTASVKKFQQANKLTVDGIAGSQTQNKISTVVKGIQNDLKSLKYYSDTVDGVYGNNTKAAVKNFQSKNGLPTTGIANVATLNKIKAVKSAKNTTPSTGTTSNTSNTSAITPAFVNTNTNVIKYSLKADGSTYITKNFKVSEFACPGSDTILIDTKLAVLLQDIRNHFGKPVMINSGYRTSTRNAQVGGSKNSYHLKGRAADIYISGVSPRVIAQYAESINVPGIELNERYGYVHVDTRDTKYWFVPVWKNGKITGYKQVNTFY